MKKLIALFVLAFPMAAQADYVDVIASKMTGACSMAKYLQIVKDFDEQWAKSHNYRVEILVPLQSAELETFYWVGRAANAEREAAAEEQRLVARHGPGRTRRRVRPAGKKTVRTG